MPKGVGRKIRAEETGAKDTGAKGTGAKGTGAKGTGAKGTGAKGTGAFSESGCKTEAAAGFLSGGSLFLVHS